MNEQTLKKDVKILVIDDERGIRDLLSYELNSQGYEVTTAANGFEALDIIKKEKVQLVISDIKMPKMDGISVLDKIKTIDPTIEVIMATGYGTIETAVASMKKGAYDFVQKPFNINEILILIEKALEKSELKALIALYETSKTIFSTVKFDDLLPILIRLSLKLLKADTVSIMLIDKKQKLSIVASQGLDSEISKEANISVGERVAGRIAKTGESCIIVGPLENDERFKDIPSKYEIKSSIICPLKTKDKILGVMCASRIKGDINFVLADKHYADIFAAQVSQAIENSNLYEQLEKKIDELNEAYTRLSDMHVQLIHSEKLAAIGELASGVAHELNNPLTIIMGLLELMIEDEDIGDEKKEDFREIKLQAERCRRIIFNLLQFARKHDSKKEKTNVNDIIKKTLELIQYDLMNSNIEIVLYLDESLPEIEVDPYKMQQVFLNLISNARHAMEELKKGKLTIKTELMGNKVRILFNDTGCGIAKDNITKIFDPFFTTKEVGKGTGLGLSISYGIINEHSGEIAVESKENEGATFTVILPQK